MQRGAVADALDLEALLEALGDALDHVRDQRARQAVQRAVLAAVGRPRDARRRLLLRDRHAQRDVLRELAERPVDLHAAGRRRPITPAGTRLAVFRFGSCRRYQTKQMTSPPTPFASAVRLVITPLEVDRIAMPMPPSTRGRRSLRA